MSKKIFDPQSKILANIDYVKEYMEEGYSPPILVEIDPSNTCNHGCHFCISSYIHLPESKDLSTYDKSIMSKDMLYEVADNLMDMGVKAINWTGGGEPTINPALKEIIEHIGENSQIKMGMFTNGTLLDKFDLFNAIVDNFTWIRFSIDAGTRETYESIRRSKPGYGWDKMIANLEKLIWVNNKRYEYFKDKIDIGVGFVITPDTYKEIVPFAKFFSQFDLTYCQFKPEIVNKEREGGTQRTIDFWTNEVDPHIQEAKAILGDKFQINGYKLDDLKNDPDYYGRTYEKCLGSQLSPCIGADGHIYVCTNHRGYEEYSYGSLYERSFKEIWEDTLTRKFIMHGIEKVEKFSKCTKLCKPHESNKKLWEISEQFTAGGNKAEFFINLTEDCKKINVDHPEFI